AGIGFPQVEDWAAGHRPQPRRAATIDGTPRLYVTPSSGGVVTLGASRGTPYHGMVVPNRCELSAMK
ncbi:hypothetical protein, partial [Salinispora pacifica]|uniref:hypothetical protein n=1 Tax=Salinispora pacifica TaxID=351187 RepID=UPI0005BDF6BF